MHFKLCPILAAIITATIGCSRMERVDAPWDKEPLPVVLSVISPDLPIRVFLLSTLNSNGDSFRYPPELAKVYIKQELGHELALCLSEDKKVFSRPQDDSLRVKPGVRYDIRVQYPEPYPLITATTTVPQEAALIQEASLIQYAHDGSQKAKGYAILSCWWQKLSDRQQGYWLLLGSRSVGFIESATSCYTSNERLLIESDSTAFDLYLATTDPYLKSFLKSTQISNNQVFFPGEIFISILLQNYAGVLPMFSNINNGIGLFGSYLMDHKRINLEKR